MANSGANVENLHQGDVLFNITAFDLAGNNLTVTQTDLTSSNLTIDRHKSDSLKSNHIQLDLTPRICATYCKV